MRTLGFVMLVAFSFPAHAQSVKDGNGLLDYCGHFVANLDSPSSQDGPDPKALWIITAINRDKISWCNGYLQATWEHIVDIKESEALGLRISPPAGTTTENAKGVVEAVIPMSAICFPQKGVTIASPKWVVSS